MSCEDSQMYWQSRAEVEIWIQFGSIYPAETESNLMYNLFGYTHTGGSTNKQLMCIRTQYTLVKTWNII